MASRHFIGDFTIASPLLRASCRPTFRQKSPFLLNVVPIQPYGHPTSLRVIPTSLHSG